MKTISIKFLTILVLLLSISVLVEAKPVKKTLLFNISMHCHSCEGKIKNKLIAEQGISKVKTSLKENTVQVTYDENKIGAERIIKSLKEIGYSAFPVGENCSTKKGGCLNNSPTQINTMR